METKTVAGTSDGRSFDEIMQQCAEMNVIDLLYEFSKQTMERIPVGFMMNFWKKNISSNLYSMEYEDYVERPAEEQQKIKAIEESPNVIYLPYGLRRGSGKIKDVEFECAPWEYFEEFYQYVDMLYLRLCIDGVPRFYKIEDADWTFALRDIKIGKVLSEKIPWKEFLSRYKAAWEACEFEMVVFPYDFAHFWNIVDDLVNFYPGFSVSNDTHEWYQALRENEVVPTKKIWNLLMRD
ncbi:MAG: hypothetical protein WDA18_09570 [Candidatus Ratteibacteria bacterium]|jgi:hypothetical protein